MIPKHTPGPWQLKYDAALARLCVTSERIGQIAILCDHDLGRGEHQQDDANALLIAAAPELLAVCLALDRLDWCAGYELGTGPNPEALDAALTLAREVLARIKDALEQS